MNAMNQQSLTLANIPTLTMSDLAEYLHVFAYTMRSPVFIWGIMGVGKSAGVKQFCDHLSQTKSVPVTLVDCRLGQYDSVDLRGVPDLDHANRTTTWFVPATLPFKSNPHFSDDGITVLFLDEANAANQAVSGVAYQLVQNRAVGEHALRDNVIIIAAGNREGDRGVTNRQPAPLSNRFLHIEVVPSHTATANYILDAGLAPEGAAFLHFKPEMVHTYDPGLSEKAFASGRTIEEALKVFAQPGLTDRLKELGIAGWCGSGWASEFLGFVDVYNDVAKLIPQIMANPTTAPIPTELSQLCSVAVNIAGRMDHTNADHLWGYVGRLGGDFQTLIWTMAHRRDLKATGGKLEQTQAFVKYYSANRAVFTHR